ncbi:zinc finger CCCH domain-containing protein 27 [Tanacetum coccineum]|uniref:Zinc finger CCCH domain-containing protein 27 n=1 Tax=Tanacetum coccineum TaxID=301880 RepID=A0ABQ5D326_9ASTR
MEFLTSLTPTAPVPTLDKADEMILTSYITSKVLAELKKSRRARKLENIHAYKKQRETSKFQSQVRALSSVYVMKGSDFERQKTKEEMERMIAKAILQERGNIQAEISLTNSESIDNHIPSQVDAYKVKKMADEDVRQRFTIRCMEHQYHIDQMKNFLKSDIVWEMVQKGVQNIPKFGGEDVKGWLVQIEQFFEDNNVPDESKVSFISTHLYEIAWEWHKQFLRIIRGEVAWVIYKEALLLRFGNNKQFLSNDVKDSSCGLHVIDKVGDLLVNNNHCEVNLERSECAHKLFDEMSIKEIHKQYTLAEYCDASVKESIEVEQGLGDDVVVESVKELVDGDNGLIDDRLLASNCDQEGFGEDVNLREKVTDIKTNDVSRLKSFESTKGGLEMLTRNGVNYMEGLVGVGNFQKYEVRLTRVKYALLLMLHECSICLDISSFGQRYVHTAKTKGEYILASKQVFDPGGKQVRDLGGYGGESVFNKLELENNCSVVAVILVGPDIGSSVTTPFVQALFEKDYQWLCDVNKFSKDSISWFCKFRVECVGVQSDVNHDDGLVVCNQLVQECEGYKKDESCNHSYLGLIKLHDVDGKKSNGNSFKDYKIVEIRMTSDYLDTFVVRTTKLNVLMLIGSYGHHTHWKSFAFRVVIGTYKWCRSSKPQGFCLRDENWPIKNSVDCFLVGGMSEFNHSVVSQRTVEEEVYDAPELVPIPVGTKEGTELVMNILDSFESSYDESGKQGTGGNRIGLKGTFLDYVTVMEIQVGNLNDRVIDSSVGTGANNDLAIPNYSPLSDNLLNDIAHVAPFEANEVGFENGYYLADGIYLQWATFVKSFTVA